VAKKAKFLPRKRSCVLQAEGEAQAITIIDEQLRNNPTYLEWLKATKWDGVLPSVNITFGERRSGRSRSHTFYRDSDRW
jgi:hypothetical protein